MSKYNLTDILEQYRIGSGWTTDFDYDGMLKAGLAIKEDTPLEIMKDIVEDFTDVNYHREAAHLYDAIEAIEANDGDYDAGEDKIKDFHAEIRKTQEEQGMDIEPTLGKFMDSKMEEGEKKELPKSIADKERAEIEKDAKKASGMMKEDDVEEVTSREGSRIEGLLNRELKRKFLFAFEDLYFDLVEEDPFAAEDVIDHLGIEMLKHLDAVQAQGDKLAGVNTDADFEREQRMQMSMREEDSIEEGISTSDITKALKDDAKATDSEIKQYMASVKKAGDKFDDVDDYVEDFKNYVADKSLQEHFGRFMKDYQ